MIKVLFICHGNICRSTMAEYVMKHLVKQSGIESDFFIDSAGTSNEEHGNPVHRGTQKKLRKEGIPCGNHRARKMCREEYAAFDYIICMERYNIQTIIEKPQTYQPKIRNLISPIFHWPHKEVPVHLKILEVQSPVNPHVHRIS